MIKGVEVQLRGRWWGGGGRERRDREEGSGK